MLGTPRDKNFFLNESKLKVVLKTSTSLLSVRESKSLLPCLEMAFPEVEKNLSLLYILVPYSQLNADHTRWLMDSIELNLIGLKTEVDGRNLGLLQLATANKVLMIKFQKTDRNRQNQHLSALLTSNTLLKAGTELWKDSAVIFETLRIHLNNGSDLTSVFSKLPGLSSKMKIPSLFETYSTLYPTKKKLFKDKESKFFKWLSPLTQPQIRYAIIDPYITFKIAQGFIALVNIGNKINLESLNQNQLVLFSKNNAISLELEVLSRKTGGYKSSIDKSKTMATVDGVQLLNDQFKNKLNFRDLVDLTLSDGSRIRGTVKLGKHGKRKIVNIANKSLRGRRVESVKVIEEACSISFDDFLKNAFMSGFFWGVKFPTDSHLYCEMFDSTTRSPVGFLVPSTVTEEIRRSFLSDLNPSQHKAALQSLFGKSKVNFIQGPPGTGKTTVISAIVSADQEGEFVITAQSNTATKNLADSLNKRNIDFIILISDNYYVEWHEAGYTHLTEKTIQTSKLDPNGLDNRLLERRVILCTLAQLSSPKVSPALRRKLSHIIVDEATQVFDGMIPHLFDLYQKTLQRITFVGDQEQLAPFGGDNIRDITSAFDRIKSNSSFLDTTYRLPFSISNFISKSVYKGKLICAKGNVGGRSNFVFIEAGGVEKDNGKGKYWNDREIAIVSKLVVNEFKTKDFLVITGYTLQRDMIINAIKSMVPNKDEASKLCSKIRTVDTAQGQEADYIIFSLVRTIKSGFLSNKRRMNVALTRCKEVLIVLATEDFLVRGEGRNTLVGKLLTDVSPLRMSYNDVLNGKEVLKFRLN